MKKGNDRYLWSGGKTFTPCAARTIVFQREKLKLFGSLFHSVYLVFTIRLISIADLFACVIFGTCLTKINAVS